MTKEVSFTMLMTSDDKKALVQVAKRLERSQADAVRQLVKAAHGDLTRKTQDS